MTQPGAARRNIVPTERYHSEQLAPGVVFHKFYPGGKEGPNGEVHFLKQGGQSWADHFLLGSMDDPFQVLIPDIRMPANQYWPLHWHDAWTVVLILEGSCVIGDWEMQVGDIFITEPSIEYGPLVIGPQGCRLLEIFAQAQGAAGGYAPEFWDHPTIQGIDAVFKERSELNRRNDGRQILSLEGNLEGITKTRLTPGAHWDLGEPNDMDRGFMCDTRLAAGETISRHQYGDWRAILVLDGTLEICGKTIEKDGYLVISPNSQVPAIAAGATGAHLLELARTARGAERQPG